MGKFLIILTFLGSNSDLNTEYMDAFENIRKATLAYPSVKSEVNELTNDAVGEFKERTGLTEEEFVYFGYFYPIFYNKINTKPFSKLTMDVSGYKIRPDFEYRFDSPGEITSEISLIREF